MAGYNVQTAVDTKHYMIVTHEVNQAVAIGMLKQLGCRRIHTANNGREALDKTEQTHYGLIFMDMQMPVMNGYQATAVLRERQQALAVTTEDAVMPHTPVVALTANAMTGNRECCLAVGADDYLSKPCSAIGLRNVLEKWLPLTGSSCKQGHRVSSDCGTHVEKQ